MKTENEMMTKEQENMQQNKKAKGTFIAIMCCAFLLGGFLGGFGTWLQKSSLVPYHGSLKSFLSCKDNHFH